MNRISIKNAHTHNLKGIDLTLQGGALIVFSGVSGSGKSSLAFDTLFVEGQRRYVESLPASARRQLQALETPEIDSIQGLSPTLSIEQKSVGRNPRSTVGTLTEIHDYLRLLFARASTPHCPESDEPLRPQTPAQIARQIKALNFSRILLLAPTSRNKRGQLREELDHLKRSGFTRVRIDGEIAMLETAKIADPQIPHDLDVVIDRLSLKSASEQRVLESVEQALAMGDGVCIALDASGDGAPELAKEILFAKERFSPKSGKSYPPLQPQDFSHNSPGGMCPKCQGLGISQDWNLTRAIDPDLSIAENPCAFAVSYQTVRHRNIFDNLANLYGFDVHTPWRDLTEHARSIYLHGSDRPWITMQFIHPVTKKRWIDRVQWKGVLKEAWDRYQGYKTQRAKAALGQYLIEALCSECGGSRLRAYPKAAKLCGSTLPELCQLTIDELVPFAADASPQLHEEERAVAAPLIEEIQRRLAFLQEVGLGYLHLDRPAPTLSGGESQRVRLASQVGCGLVGMTYILDEPSIGLHPIDNAKLLNTLRRLRDQGNTVVVVEHDEETICAADQIVDFGPGAGARGGRVLSSGSLDQLLEVSESLTAQYLLDRDKHLLPSEPLKAPKHFLTLAGVRHRNLRDVTARFPLQRLTAIAGVSGSGKSTLIFEVLYPALARALATRDLPTGHFKRLTNAEGIGRVICIDQSPIGRLPRSNPATYTKVFDDIRQIFADLPESRARGFQPGRFSFNVAEGSCAHCQGMGWIAIDLEFAADDFVLCASCRGRRFDEQTLSVKYRGRSIADVLAMTVQEAAEFFASYPQLKQKLATLTKVGLDYLQLGQPSPQLSGGEAQRIKLARELAKPPQGHTLYLLDEPTTGLHAHDAMGLLGVLRDLVARGHTAIVIEHHLDFFRNADWIIELGPGGGPRGGQIIAAGTPASIGGKPTPTGAVLAAKSPLESRSQTFKRAVEREATIAIMGARQNNLKDLTLALPRDRLIACAGPSGSGKSSLCLETLYAEGQRRYIESLSPYARQFVRQLPKPDVDRIEGLSPAIAIEQKLSAGNPRSTVGTLTEVYDALRVLFSRLGVAHCPDSGAPLMAMTPDILLDYIDKLPVGERLQILAPVSLRRGESFAELLGSLLRGGYARARIDGTIAPLDFAQIEKLSKRPPRQIEVVIDRLVAGKGERQRWLQSIEQGLSLRSKRIALLRETGACEWFHMGFCSPTSGKSYPAITPRQFSFNHAEGQCPECEGLGTTTGVRFEGHLPTDILTVRTLLTLIWGKEGAALAAPHLERSLAAKGFTGQTKLQSLSDEQRSWLFLGDRTAARVWTRERPSLHWKGLYPVLARLAKAGANPLRAALGRFLEEIDCPVCRGGRLNPLSLGVRIENHNLPELCSWSIARLRRFLMGLALTQERGKSLFELYRDLLARLEFLERVGLEYLSLDRKAPTLSNGEAQRIRLAAQLGSQLTGVLYILDEPSTGLHPFDSARLSSALLGLRDLGNTLLIVERDLELLRNCDHILELGPGAGAQGGEVIHRGSVAQLSSSPSSPTGRYLAGKIAWSEIKEAPAFTGKIEIRDAHCHNLKGFAAQLPTPSLTCVTGVSGSGKSTLLKAVLLPAFRAVNGWATPSCGRDRAQVTGLEPFGQCLFIDQNPLAKTVRADVGSYIEIFSPLRALYANTPQAKILGLSSSHFSPNTPKGMCRKCRGYGERRVELRFMAPLSLPCGECRGQRLNPLSLSVAYRGKTFGELFELTVAECLAFFSDHSAITRALTALQRIGLDYLKLGQSLGTLSGGEAQRLKIAEQLRKRRQHRVLYLLDEPTIGLHPIDLPPLIGVLRSLVDQGHTVVCIEHNPLLIGTADWILDLGPGPGESGGQLVAQGTVDEIKRAAGSRTGQYLNALKGVALAKDAPVKRKKRAICSRPDSNRHGKTPEGF